MNSKASNTYLSTCIKSMPLCLIMFTACSGLRIPQPLTGDQSDWTMFGKDVNRTNSSREEVTPPFKLEWEFDVTGGIGNGSLLVVDSIVIVGNLRGELYAINALTGKRIGWVDLGEAIQGTPAIEGNIAIVPLSNTDFSLIAFDLVEGKPLWRGEYGDIEASPLLHGGKVFVGNTAGEFFCVEAATGNQLWKFDLPDNTRQKGIRSSAAGVENTLVFGSEDGFLYALDMETGKQRWKYNTGHSIAASPCVAREFAIIANLDGKVSAVSLRTGETRWQFDGGASIYAAPSYSENSIFVGTTAGTLYALDATTGSRLWSADLGSVINSSAVIAGNVLYVGTLKKTLFGLRVSDGTIVVKQDVQGRIKTSPVVAHGRLYVATDEKLILSFRSEGR